MFNYCYDGSFDGLLNIIFEAYNNKDEITSVSSLPNQLNIAFSDIYVDTDYDKARRVEKYIKSEISYEFYKNICFAFLSYRQDKDIFIVKTVYAAIKIGKNILDTMDENAVEVEKMIRQVLSERHKYLGILRFKELKDKTLFSTIEPKNNILPILISHFKNRLVNDKFIIWDKKRNTAVYYDTNNVELFHLDSVNAELSEDEENFEKLWKVFHKAISIKERENKKLQMSNLPKYYWKHLVEDMS